MVQELKHIALKLLLGLAVLMGLGVIYQSFQLEQDLAVHAPFDPAIEAAIAADVVYLGDCSDTYCAAGEEGTSITQYLQAQLPEAKVAGISANGFHSGIYLQLLEALAARTDTTSKKVIVTLNLRSFAPHIYYDYFYSPTIYQQLLLSDPDYSPFVNRLRLTFNPHKSAVRQELEELAREAESVPLFEENSNLQQPSPTEWKKRIDVDAIAATYINDLAVEINHSNPRLQDLESIAALAKAKNWELWFHLIPLNHEQANQLVGSELQGIAEQNLGFLSNYFGGSNMHFIDNTKLLPATGFMHEESGSHFYAGAKKEMARSIVEHLER